MKKTRKEQRAADLIAARNDAWTSAEHSLAFEKHGPACEGSRDYYARHCATYMATLARLEAGADLHVIEIDRNHGGFTGTETIDGGGSWFYCGNVGAVSRNAWRTIARHRGAILRVQS